MIAYVVLVVIGFFTILFTAWTTLALSGKRNQEQERHENEFLDRQ